ncbi:unnamed protein product [Clonostachys rosea]|uniref:FMN hydroxy acid dehydrogenase domain-containing protein n=1 Tax=Bionectria ochroleuca TaxID=29856 RepID=A0ABY6UFA7_BIOOC|nr:unnamed protein product [Clonostachys rosea]
MISDLATSLASWPLLLVGLAVVGVASVPIYNLFFHPLRDFPGPTLNAATRIPYTRMMSSGQTHQTLYKLHQEYGDFVRISPDELSIQGEHVWNELMGHRKQGVSENGKDPAVFSFSKFGLNSVVGGSREDHARMRRSLAHGFSAAAIEEQEPIITSYVDLLVQRLKERSNNGENALDMTSWYNWTTFDIIGDLAFGESFRCLQESDYHPWVSLIFKRIKHTSLMIAAYRWGALKNVVFRFVDQSLGSADTTHVNLIQEKLNARGAMETIRPDYYHAMTAEGPERESYSKMELHETASVLITAGSETTATTLSGVTYLLGKHPKVLQKLVKEVRTTFRYESEINMHSVQRLEYMLAVLNEALRLYPPVPGAIPRKMNPEGGIINGRWVPGGTVVGIHQYPLHYNPKYFQAPESFIPERWQDDPRFSTDAKKAFQPFSFGPRNCLGKNLAYAEMRLILARIVWNFDLRLAKDSDGWIDRGETYLIWRKPALNVYLVPMVTIKVSDERVLCVDDIRKIATAKLPRIISEFYNDGSTTQVTVRENSSAYSKYRLRARVLVDVSKVDPSTTVLAEKIDFPLCVSPAGLQAMAHPDGELATARACANRRVHMGISSFANHSVEDIRAAGLTVGPLTNAMQLYTMQDREMQLRIIHRAEAAGCKAIFLTADSPVLGVRFNEVHNDFRTPEGLNLPMLEKTSEMIRSQTHDDGFTAFNSDSHSWEKEIPWLRKHSKMEIWIKGVLTAEDVHLAIQYGCDGIIVSNHGGRQLDETPATADVLLECAKAANGKIRIHVDGGIRTGTDIFKALALGAECVWIGRPMLWGLAYNGEAGVTKTLDILYEEFKRCMQLTGCNTIDDISLASIGAVATYMIAKILHELFFHPLRNYPGPLLSRFTRIPYWIANLTGNQVRHMHQLHSRYGPIVRYGPNDMSYTDSQAWKDIYGHKKDRADNPKDRRFYPQPDSGVHSLITASKEDHARVRRMFALAFSDRGLKQQEPLFKKYADLMVSKLHESSATDQDLVKILNFTTFDIMAELTFGEPLGLLEGSKYSPWVSNIFQAIKAGPVMQMGLYYPLLGRLLKSLAPKKLQEMRRSHAQHTISRVDQRLARGSTQPDLWNLVVTDEGEKKLSLQEMYNNADVFMLAGTETTATLLSGLTFYLLINPQKMRTLVEEIRGAFDSTEEMVFDRLAGLKYLHACIQEGLRMYPPVPSSLSRVAPEHGTIICDGFVPSGTSISVHHTATYRSPKNFRNPNIFAPERWLGAEEYADDLREALQPFHLGPRNCLGQNMAWHEMRLLLAQLLYNFDLELCEESKDWADQKVFVLWEKKPLLCKLKPVES